MARYLKIMTFILRFIFFLISSHLYRSPYPMLCYT
nr:MAG TPA: hypothetical protein [Caudoviricetes sp.]